MAAGGVVAHGAGQGSAVLPATVPPPSPRCAFLIPLQLQSADPRDLRSWPQPRAPDPTYQGLWPRERVVRLPYAVAVADGEACDGRDGVKVRGHVWQRQHQGTGVRRRWGTPGEWAPIALWRSSWRAGPSSHRIWAPQRSTHGTTRHDTAHHGRAQHAPFMSGGKSAVNSLKDESSCPSSTPPEAPVGQFISTARMACVAQALVMTWRAKNTWEASGGAAPAPPLVSMGCWPEVAPAPSSWTHLKRKTRP